MLMGFEEIDVADDDIREEFPCPFCSEFFDIVGLCCHIDDEHPVEARNGVSILTLLLNFLPVLWPLTNFVIQSVPHPSKIKH